MFPNGINNYMRLKISHFWIKMMYSSTNFPMIDLDKTELQYLIICKQFLIQKKYSYLCYCILESIKQQLIPKNKGHTLRYKLLKSLHGYGTLDSLLQCTTFKRIKYRTVCPYSLRLYWIELLLEYNNGL